MQVRGHRDVGQDRPGFAGGGSRGLAWWNGQRDPPPRGVPRLASGASIAASTGHGAWRATHVPGTSRTAASSVPPQEAAAVGPGNPWRSPRPTQGDKGHEGFVRGSSAHRRLQCPAAGSGGRRPGEPLAFPAADSRGQRPRGLCPRQLRSPPPPVSRRRKRRPSARGTLGVPRGRLKGTKATRALSPYLQSPNSSSQRLTSTSLCGSGGLASAFAAVARAAVRSAASQAALAIGLARRRRAAAITR
jgi:hypothetical protein